MLVAADGNAQPRIIVICRLLRLNKQLDEACIAAGLVGGEGFAVDASLIVADANK
jgi:hypothetical protein